MFALGQLSNPVTQVVPLDFRVSQDRSRAMDQQHAQVTVATLADPQQAVVSAGTVLPRRKAK